MHRILPVILLLTLNQAAPAQESAATDARVKAVAPFLDEQTIAVVRVDLEKLDPEALVKKLGTLAKIAENDRNDVKRHLEGARTSLLGAGARDVFIVVSLFNVPGEPLVVVVPLAKGADGAAVTQALRPLITVGRLEVQKIGQAVVGAARPTLQRLQELQPAEMPELAKAFASGGDASVLVAVLMPQALRRSLEETMPNLPAAIGGGSIKTMTRGFRWGAVGADVTPDLSLRLTVQADDAAAARALEKLVVNVFAGIRKADKGKPVATDVAQILQALTPKVNGDRLVLTLGDAELGQAVTPLLVKMWESKGRAQSMNNLKHIALALHSYFDVHKTFPAHASYGKQGRPLLSWRVHVLPYLDQEKLYKEFHLDDPWDSEHNKKLIARMPAVFRAPTTTAGIGKTTYLAPVGKDTMFPPGVTGVGIKDVTDGTSNTIFVVESDDKHAVEWTKPDDLKVDLKQPLRGLAGEGRGWFLAVFADGSVHVLQRTIDPATLRALFTRNGGESIPPY